MAKASPADFLITDPLAQPGVVETVPEGVEMIDLDDMPYRAEPQVRCAFCTHHQWHNDGYFAILSDGQRAPCGNCCAAKFDSVKKRTIDRSRTRLKRERDNRGRARALAAGLDDVSEIVEAADRTLGAAATALYVLPQVLTDEAIEDMAAHEVEGLDFLDGCTARLDFARKTINAIRRLDGITEKDQERYVTSKSEALAEVRVAVSFMRACATFFDPSNLAKAATWAQSRGMTFGVRQFEVKGTKLHAKGPGLWQNIDVPEVALPPSVQNFTEHADDPG